MIDWSPTGRRVYIIEPHQDDAALFKAQMVAHHTLAGREVHAVLMSNGSTSGALAEINGTTVDNGWWGSPPHEPDREGYAPLSQVEFGLARTREWSQSWLALGVPVERQHFGKGLASSDLLPDAITVAYATDVMTYWAAVDALSERPAASFKTMWWGDTTQDHANCGAALRALKLSGNPDFADAQWMVRFEQEGAPGSQQYSVPANLLPTVKAMQRRAGWCYCAWAPKAGSFAIGRHSVPDMFDNGPLIMRPNTIVKNP